MFPYDVRGFTPRPHKQSCATSCRPKCNEPPRCDFDPCCQPPRIIDEPCCEPACPMRRKPACCEPACPPRYEQINCQRECEPPWPPPCPPPSRLVLVGSLDQRCLPERLSVTGLPMGLLEPLTLVGVEQSCDAPTVCVKETRRGPAAVVAEVRIPLVAWVRDRRGRVCAGYTQFTACVPLPRGCVCQPGAYVAEAQVRLVNGGPPVTCPTFDVRLAVCVQVFMVQMPPRGRCGRGACDPFFSMPLYPQLRGIW